MDFLPRSLVYNYGDGFAQSNKQMEDMLSQLERFNNQPAKHKNGHQNKSDRSIHNESVYDYYYNDKKKGQHS